MIPIEIDLSNLEIESNSKMEVENQKKENIY